MNQPLQLAQQLYGAGPVAGQVAAGKAPAACNCRRLDYLHVLSAQILAELQQQPPFGHLRWRAGWPRALVFGDATPIGAQFLPLDPLLLFLQCLFSQGVPDNCLVGGGKLWFPQLFAYHGAPQASPVGCDSSSTTWASTAAACEPGVLNPKQGEHNSQAQQQQQQRPCAGMRAQAVADPLLCTHPQTLPCRSYTLLSCLQAAGIASGGSAKQAAVLESDSGHYNYESCRTSCDSDQAEGSADSSSGPETPAAQQPQKPAGNSSYSTSSMSSDAPVIPAQHGLAAAASEATPPASPAGQGMPSGLKSTFSKLFGSNWGSESSSSSGEGGHGLIAAFRAIMPKTSGSQSGSGALDDCQQQQQQQQQRAATGFVSPCASMPGLLMLRQQLCHHSVSTSN
jgi:hypothetical protein